jgi:hypothetical protein
VPLIARRHAVHPVDRLRDVPMVKATPGPMIASASRLTSSIVSRGVW